MKAVTYQGHKNMEVREVNDPTIEESTDAIIKITASGICGSDLHLYHQGDLFMDPGFVIGHEPMGIVEEVGKDVKTLKKGIEWLYLLTSVVVTAFIVITIWSLNATTLTHPLPIGKWTMVDFSVLVPCTGTTGEDKQSI